jgi:hypothetical protein
MVKLNRIDKTEIEHDRLLDLYYPRINGMYVVVYDGGLYLVPEKGIMIEDENEDPEEVDEDIYVNAISYKDLTDANLAIWKYTDILENGRFKIIRPLTAREMSNEDD